MSDRKQLLTGIAIGLFCAFLVSFLVFIGTNPGFTFSDYLNIYVYGHLLAPILSVALTANLGLFFLFLKLDKDMISRGILAATLIVGVIIFILKFM
jgi:hypothetical protein